MVVEDEPFMAEAICDGLRLEAIAADIAGDGECATMPGVECGLGSGEGVGVSEFPE